MSDEGPTEIQRYHPRNVVPPAEAIGRSADAMEEFNRLLWQIARTVFIIVAMLLGISLVVLAYYAAEFLATLSVVGF